MTKKLRVGVIGAGIADRHLTGFDWNEDSFEVPVLCSLDEDRGRELCAKYGIPEYSRTSTSSSPAMTSTSSTLRLRRIRISNSAGKASNPANT